MTSSAIVLFLVVIMMCAIEGAARPLWHQLTPDYTFEDYCRDWGKRYPDEWKPRREALFKQRLREALDHNQQGATWQRGINEYSDWTDEERHRRSKTRVDPVHGANAARFQPKEALAVPASVDYRLWLSPRVLTDVKSQGLCGNCWAFSATQALESHVALATGRDALVLSVQQITACSKCRTKTHKIVMCDGCDGGSVEGAWHHANNTRLGITEEWLYPFTEFFNVNATPLTCVNVTDLEPRMAGAAVAMPTADRVHVTGHVQVDSNNATAMMLALAQAGPVSISVSAFGWEDFEAGIFRVPPNTTAANYSAYFMNDHSVQMVGYGYDAERAAHYWIVRNSWGQSWGEMGYIRLHRAADGSAMPCSPPGVFLSPICGTSGCLLNGQYPLVAPKESVVPYVRPERHEADWITRQREHHLKSE